MRISISLSRDHYEKLQQLAASEDRPVAKMAAKLLLEGLEPPPVSPTSPSTANLIEDQPTRVKNPVNEALPPPQPPVRAVPQRTTPPRPARKAPDHPFKARRDNPLRCFTCGRPRAEHE